MKTIDFYTTVIDNYWDAGFSLNLAISLLKENSDIHIRYFCDDKGLFLKLKWDLEVKNLTYFDLKDIKKYIPSQVIFNFFDRKIDFDFLHTFDFEIKLINFSYFLMHIWVRSLHNTHYQSKNISVTHFIPSLLPEWWGIIINPYLQEYKNEILEKWIISARKEFFPNLKNEIFDKVWVWVFCYKETFEEIKEIILENKNIIFFVFDYDISWENIINMPFLNIIDYYKFLYLCDKNIVRWENSVVESIFTKKPFLWDIYKENNWAHKDKIEDFWRILWNWDLFEIFSWFNNIYDTKKYFQLFIDYKAKIELDENIINPEKINLIKNIHNFLL